MKGSTLNTGRTHFKEGYTPWNKGTVGIMKAWNKGKKLDKPAWNKGLKMPEIMSEKNPMWKGDKVSYRTLHRWVVSHRGQPDTCEYCKTSGLVNKKIHWANISRLYKRDLDDWMRLCAKCHKAYDMDKLMLTEIRG